MKKTADIISSLQNLKGDLSQRFAVKEIGIFGSVAREEQTERSDIDLLVEFSKPVSLVTFMRLEYYLSDMLGNKVDLVTFDSLKPMIQPDILSEVIYV
jgi:hypothetical protein